MAELIDFRYHGQRTVLHGIDARVKLAGMAALSVATLTSAPLGLALASFLVAAGAITIRRLALGLFLKLKLFWLILLAVVLARTLTTPGDLMFQWQFIALSRDGFIAGLMISWRLLLIVYLSLLITVTTSASEIRTAIHWFLHPIPLVNAQVISDMIMLLIRFIPVILIRCQQISDAQKSRSVACRKNPVYRIRMFTMSLLRQVFLESEQLGFAMAARCYDTQRTIPARTFNPRDIVFFLLLVVFCFVVMLT